MGGTDMLIYPLRPISTPSHLLTRGFAVLSVSVNLAEHHLISTACLLSWSSVAELLHPRPCCASYPSTLRAKSKKDQARQHHGKAEPGLLLWSTFLPIKRLPWLTTPFGEPVTQLDWLPPSPDQAARVFHDPTKVSIQRERDEEAEEEDNRRLAQQWGGTEAEAKATAQGVASDTRSRKDRRSPAPSGLLVRNISLNARALEVYAGLLLRKGLPMPPKRLAQSSLQPSHEAIFVWNEDLHDNVETQHSQPLDVDIEAQREAAPQSSVVLKAFSSQ
ncbi:hypothetical protein TEA_030046 [Camellia sinensis var. sinensis]|uniref:Uncharacterized protein n=1 Tax=Camellia sinensis var. sinensis TaxID=542762 RepID=A0A4S4DCJ1_CAMSN|nr:hypothetical protein TEA_030046 [Camellia sinensis var. sinensis]